MRTKPVGTVVYRLETSPTLVQVLFRAFPENDLKMLAGHLAVLAHEKGRGRALELVCRSRRSAEALARAARPLFARVTWKGRPGARAVPIGGRSRTTTLRRGDARP